MPLTINKNVARGLNALGFWIGTFFTLNPDNSYPTGGYAITAQMFKLGVIEYMAPVFCLNVANTAAIVGVYNAGLGTIQFYWCAGAGAAMAEVTNATDISGYTGTGVVYGKG